MSLEELYTREHFIEVLKALHRDQTGLAQALLDIKYLANGWSWVTDGRGSYEWDDSDYQKEFGYCIDKVIEAVDNALFRSSKAHQICCGRYRNLNFETDKPSIQLSFPFDRTYKEHKEDVMKFTTIIQ